MTHFPFERHEPPGAADDGIPEITDDLRAALDVVMPAVPESATSFPEFLALVGRLEDELADERAASGPVEPPPDGRPSLLDAVTEAITVNRKVASATADELRTLAEALRATTLPGDDVGAALVVRVLAAEQTLLTALTGELTELADRQLDGTGTFNIVLFGRTGAGKSSLLEALQHGDGDAISPGESDWTTTVNPVSWEHCRLVDTPGIEGWGRTVSRRDLEQRAREELVTADIVILCFDSQNQKAGEFRKVASWIAEYKKPAIAVLNVRQPNWRFPTRVGRRTVRVRTSQTVADHAGHIREGLTAIGLTGTPIVAMNTQRAVFARARRPFLIPHEQVESMLAQREEAKELSELLKWSNLLVLERLLVTAIEDGAAQLRRGALLNQLVRTLDRMRAERIPAIRDDAESAAEQADAGIGRMLELLGAPESYLDGLAADDPRRPDVEAFDARLRKLEKARGGSFAVPATGTVHRHSQNVIDGLLAPLRTAAQERAEALVDSSMAARRVVERDEFERIVFDTAAVDTAAEEAVSRLTRYLERRVGVAAADVVADLEAVQPRTATVYGTAGRGYRRTVIGVTLLAAAVLFAWNVGPLVLAVGAVAGLAVPPLRRLLRKRAVKKYERELSRARGAARQAVTETFDAVRDEIADWFLTSSRAAMVGHLGELTTQALVMREVATTAEENRRHVEEAARRVGGWTDGLPDPAAVLIAAMNVCEKEAASSGRALWLGEAWCDDRTGLRDTSVSPVRTGRDRTPGPAVLPTLVRGRLPGVLAEAARTPRLGSGTYWLVQLGEILAEDPAAGAVLAELERLREDHRPRILVYGDYDAGKSSFIRRLLVDGGEPVPAMLTVSARPETEQVHEYRWGDFQLIDTPGLQSGTDPHDDRARRSVPDAALIVYMLGANPVTSDRSGLDLVLRGDPDRGVMPKLDRTVFVVNRADELSVNPLDDPEGFTQMVGRRERELLDALVATPELRRLGVTVSRERIIFLASDPFGQIGDARDVTAADFDEFRDWDGMAEVGAAFDELALGLQANSVDVSVLHAGIAALGELMAEAAAAIERDAAAIQQLDRLTEDVEDQVRVGRLVAADQHTGLTRLGLGFVDDAVTEALEIADEDRRQARLERAVRFHEDRELGQRVDEWAVETERRVIEWIRETAVVLQRRIDSQAFQRALGTSVTRPDDIRFPSAPNSSQQVRQYGSAVGQAVQVVGQLRALRVVKIGTDQAVAILRAGVAESAQLAPQSRGLYRLFTAGRAAVVRGEAATRAARIGRTAARAGQAVRIVATAAEMATMVRDLRADRRRQREFLAAKRALQEEVVGWSDEVCDTDPALSTLEAELAALDALGGTLRGDRATLQAALDSSCTRYTRYEHAVQLGAAELAPTYPAPTAHDDADTDAEQE